MAQESRSPLQMLKHPLFLLVVGSVIGSFLIPWISQKTDRNRVLREARLKKKVEIANKNTETISKLHLLVTRLGIFHKDNIRLQPSPAKLAVLQDKLSEDMNDLYADFEKEGWWWYRSLTDEAAILEIVPREGSDKLRTDIEAYEKNIVQSVAAFNDFWHRCLSKDYDFEENGNTTKIQNETYKRRDQLATERIQLVNNLLQDFTTP